MLLLLFQFWQPVRVFFFPPPCPHFLCVRSCSCQHDRLLTELILKCATIWHKSSLRLQLKKTPSCAAIPTPAAELRLAVSSCVTAALGQVSNTQQVGLGVASSQADDRFKEKEDIYKDLWSRPQVFAVEGGWVSPRCQSELPQLLSVAAFSVWQPGYISQKICARKCKWMFVFRMQCPVGKCMTDAEEKRKLKGHNCEKEIENSDVYASK